MNKQSKKFIRISLLIPILLISHLSASAQRPPTSGPNPEENTNLIPYIIAGGGLAVAAGSYFYLKSRGPKIVVGEYLPDYLLSRNILPTADAINLMYHLNPRLKDKDLMRTRKKLINPDFPEISNSLLISDDHAVQPSSSMPAALKEQVDGFRSVLHTFQRTTITIAPRATNDSLVDAESVIKELEQIVFTYERNNEESNTIKNQLMTDLIRVLNETLQNSITSKLLAEKEITLLNNISENLSELLFPAITDTLSSDQSSQLRLGDPLGDENLYLASADNSALFYATILRKEFEAVSISASSSSKGNKTMKFAFLVLKYTSTGAPITKGPEVEGKFKIQYAMPALEGRTDTYIDAEGLATYALADLPPAKLLIIITDITENREAVPVLIKTIDFRAAFEYTNRQKINEQVHIVVPIYLPHD